MRSGHFSATIVAGGVEKAGQADGVVPVPFGEEYGIRLRTHSGRRAAAKIWIDDIEVTGGGLVVPAYGYVDLETPPASPGSRFRFASVHSGAAYAAGKGGRDVDGTKGLIKVEFQHEKERPKPAVVRTAYSQSPYSYRGYDPTPISRGVFEDVGAESCCMGFAPTGRSTKTCGGIVPPPLAEGVMVAGSASAQTFYEVHFETDGLPAVVITLKLRGYDRAEASCCQHSYVPSATSYCSCCGRQADLLSNICACGGRLR